MKIRTTEHDGKKVQYWYDTHVRCWYAMYVDDEGNQIGPVIDSFLKNVLLMCVATGHLSLYDS